MNPSVNQNNDECKPSLQELCRCCMSHIPKNLQLIFGSESLEIYLKTTLIQVNEMDMLPKVICKSCSSQLDAMRAFIEKCIQTNKKLLDLVKEVVNPSEVKVESVKDETVNEEDALKHEIDFEEDTADVDFFDDNNTSSEPEDHDWCASSTKKEKVVRKSRKHKCQSVKIELTCSTCQFKANGFNEMKKHYKDSNKCKKNSVQCPMCDFSAKFASVLDRHMVVHSSVQNQHICRFCNKKYKYKETLRRHLEVRHNVNDARLKKKCTNAEELENSLLEPEISIKTHNKKSMKSNCTEELQENEIAKLELNNDASDISNFKPPSPEDDPPLKKTVLKRKKRSRESQKNSKLRPKSLSCSTCDKTFTNAKLLEKHFKENSTCKLDASSAFSCEICYKICASESDLVDHKSVHTKKEEKKKVFKCDICGNSYNIKASLEKHVLTEHEDPDDFPEVTDKEERNVCNTCKQEFVSSNKLSYHIRLQHPEELKFMCDTCGKWYPNDASLKSHWDRTHNPDKKPDNLTCKTCSEVLPTKYKLASHIASKHTEKKHLCTYCGKAFVAPSPLELHIMVHTGEKPFPCLICEMKFRTKEQLQNHVNIHTGAKPHRCELCGRRFRTKAFLSKHKNVHSGIRPYECDICGERFNLSGTMVVHRRRHTGERPYKCPFCEVAFTNSTSRKQHVKATHEELYAQNPDVLKRLGTGGIKVM